MKYLIITILVIFTSCKNQLKQPQPPEDKTVFLDFGYGEQEVDTSEMMEHCFTLDQLSRTPLDYEEFNFKVDTTFTVNDQKYYYRKKENELIISQSPSGDSGVMIMGKKYPLSFLFPNADKAAYDRFYITTTALINVGTHHYFLFFACLMPTNSVIVEWDGFLVDMANPKKLIRFPFSQTSDSPLCLNDFDHDGVLDYAYHDYHKITCYHIKGEHFVFDPAYYVELEGCMDRFFAINAVNSKWFFPLK
jgi:hypothetical protein